MMIAVIQSDTTSSAAQSFTFRSLARSGIYAMPFRVFTLRAARPWENSSQNDDKAALAVTFVTTAVVRIPETLNAYFQSGLAIGKETITTIAILAVGTVGGLGARSRTLFTDENIERQRLGNVFPSRPRPDGATFTRSIAVDCGPQILCRAFCFTPA
jgi:hypothetical protein